MTGPDRPMTRFRPARALAALFQQLQGLVQGQIGTPAGLLTLTSRMRIDSSP